MPAKHNIIKIRIYKTFFICTDNRLRNYKKRRHDGLLFYTIEQEILYYFFLPSSSSETVNFFLPLARRAANTLRPLAVDILSLKPCLCLRLVLDGWNVLFIAYVFLLLFLIDFLSENWAAKIQKIFIPTNYFSTKIV